MKNPYVVSADINLLLQDWAEKEKFILPDSYLFESLRNNFSCIMRQMFNNFELVAEEELVEGTKAIVEKTGLVPISLDKTYFQADLNIEITRCVNDKLEDAGLSRRPGSEPFFKQISLLKKSGVKETVLVDDVLFSGACIERLINVLMKAGIKVSAVCCGIAIAEGADKISKICKVDCVRLYENVVDEVCERDFYPGVPLCGRLVSATHNIGAPYILPFGKPVDWASIPPEHQQSFSRFCILQTIRLFEGIESCSNRQVFFKNIGRKVNNLPDSDERFVDMLKSLL